MSEDPAEVPTMSRATRAFTLFATLVSSPIARAGDDPVAADQLRRAAERGLAVVQKAARNYPRHRKCFSCHHQTLPMQAMVVPDRAATSPSRMSTRLLTVEGDVAPVRHEHRIDEVADGQPRLPDHAAKRRRLAQPAKPNSREARHLL